MSRRRALTPAQLAEVERLRERIAVCEQFRYAASAEALRKKLRRLTGSS